MKEVDKNIIKDGVAKAMDEFAQKIENLGFVRTKKMLFVREHETFADFIHVHINGSSYSGGAFNYSVSFRLHCGKRLYEDARKYLTLNGTESSLPELIDKRYHLRFNAKSGSTYERCIEDLLRFVKEDGEKWFQNTEIEIGIERGDAKDRELVSKKLLGLKIRKKNDPK